MSRDAEKRKVGKVYLVGAGPGDQKLITLKGVECLERADVVIYDLLANDKLLEYCPAHADKIYGGKQAGEQEKRQAEINALMIQHAKAGKTVVRLKGGDPFVFGRGGEEALTLAEAGIEFEVVPGVTAAIAAPAYAGIPVTHRGYASSVAFVTGHSAALDPDSKIRWEQLATAVDTLIVYMGVRHLRQITERLIAHGREPETPVSLIRLGTTPQQVVVQGNLADIAQKAEDVSLKNPAVIVVGEVNTLRPPLCWYDNKPLFGRRIIVTRARAQASEFAEHLESYGADIIQFPTIEIRPIEVNAKLDEAIARLTVYDWIIFTSVNAVTQFYAHLRENGFDVRALGNTRICAVGPKTVKALDEIGLCADFVPSQSHASAIVAELQDVATKRILLPRAKIAPDELPNGLREKGAVVDDIPIYDTVKAGSNRRDEIESDLLNGQIDMVTFTSSSTVTNFLDMFYQYPPKHLLEKAHVAVIGPSTAATVEQNGLTVDLIAKRPSVEELADEIVKFYRSSEKSG